jgi:hypothetical protein
MKTAKDLAYKAFRQYYTPLPKNDIEIMEMKEQFENWWRMNYHDNEHRDHFQAEHFVLINQKVYIQAE